MSEVKISTIFLSKLKRCKFSPIATQKFCHFDGESSFEVPILAMDEPDPLYMIKAIKTLSHLEGVVSNVFSSIQLKINEQTKKVNNVTNRIDQTKHAVDSLTNLKDQITISSPLKFPMPDNPPNYSTINESIKQKTIESILTNCIKIDLTDFPGNTELENVNIFDFLMNNLPFDRNSLASVEQNNISNASNLTSFLPFQKEFSIKDHSNQQHIPKDINNNLTLFNNEYLPYFSEEPEDLILPNNLPGLSNIAEYEIFQNIPDLVTINAEIEHIRIFEEEDIHESEVMKEIIEDSLCEVEIIHQNNQLVQQSETSQVNSNCEIKYEKETEPEIIENNLISDSHLKPQFMLEIEKFDHKKLRKPETQNQPLKKIEETSFEKDFKKKLEEIYIANHDVVVTPLGTFMMLDDSSDTETDLEYSDYSF